MFWYCRVGYIGWHSTRPDLVPLPLGYDAPHPSAGFGRITWEKGGLCSVQKPLSGSVIAPLALAADASPAVRWRQSACTWTTSSRNAPRPPTGDPLARMGHYTLKKDFSRAWNENRGSIWNDDTNTCRSNGTWTFSLTAWNATGSDYVMKPFCFIVGPVNATTNSANAVLQFNQSGSTSRSPPLVYKGLIFTLSLVGGRGGIVTLMENLTSSVPGAAGVSRNIEGMIHCTWIERIHQSTHLFYDIPTTIPLKILIAL